MLETIDLTLTLDKKTFKERMSQLNERLSELQRALLDAEIPIMVVFEGWEAAGKGMAIGRILQALDPRGFKVHYIGAPTQEQMLKPPMRRFWMMTPANGRMAFFNYSWYRQVLDDRINKDLDAGELASAYERIRIFERQFTDMGGVIVKFFFHISKKEQKKRFKVLGKDEAYAWRIGEKQRQGIRQYDAMLQATEAMLAKTSTPYAPWTLIPATCERAATSRVAETLVMIFERALANRARRLDFINRGIEIPEPENTTNLLDRVDLTLQASESDYATLPELQKELRRLQYLCYQHRRGALIVFEGWDAAGKGGAIRRLTRELDPRGYEVAPFAAPQGDEKTHHYLWRFWRSVPKAGHITLFDRSHYGRVLVERVEKFAYPDEWERAYREINEFESQLSQSGIIVIKFWLHISNEEQLKRFEIRRDTPEKQWKITDEDWRNREKWNDYRRAVSAMIERTSTPHAPWTIIEAEDKHYARLRVLNECIKRLCIVDTHDK